MRTVIVYGPPASGKTLNGEALRALYGCDGINDEGKVAGKFCIKQGQLNLVVKAPEVPPANCTIVSIYDALALLQGGAQ